MIKCDTIKIKSNYKYLLDKNINFNILFDSKKNTVNGEYYSSQGNSNIPFNLYIATNYSKQTLTIEFSSKILFDDYPNLITSETLPQCLYNLNDMGICTIDIDGVLKTGCITQADITKDVSLELTNDILTALNNNVGNYRRFKWQHYTSKGITFTKDVVGKGREEIKFYNKRKELSATAQNRRFLDLLASREQVEGYFSDKTRVEITLSSQPQIRNSLQINDTYIPMFFASDANPILAQFDRIFNSSTIDSSIDMDNYDTWAMSKILELYSGNLQLIEQEVRRLYKFRSGVNSRMAKFEQLKQMQQTPQRNIIQEVRKLLC